MSWPELDWDSVDHWAVGLVVKEHVLMQLNYPEKLLAAGGLRRKGVKEPDIAMILRVSRSELEALLRRWSRLPQSQRTRLSQLVSA
jgi:hypothetical protein